MRKNKKYNTHENEVTHFIVSIGAMIEKGENDSSKCDYC